MGMAPSMIMEKSCDDWYNETSGPTVESPTIDEDDIKLDGMIEEEEEKPKHELHLKNFCVKQCQSCKATKAGYIVDDNGLFYCTVCLLCPMPTTIESPTTTVSPS